MTKLDLVPSVVRLRAFHGGALKASGTAWFAGPDVLVTAAHCLRDPDNGSQCEGPFQVELPNGKRAVEASVLRENVDLDGALLKLPGVPGCDALPLGVLPTPDRFPPGLRWYSYGCPNAHPEGLHFSGEVTSPTGSVDGQPAIQLYCNEGGLGALQGSSGGPVCVERQVVGLIRFGPPKLAQKVILATALRDLVAAGFVELAGPLAATQATYSPLVLLVTLSKMSDPVFKKVVFISGVERADLPGTNTPQSERAIELIEHFKQRGNMGLAQLVNAIERADAELLRYVASTT